MKGTVYPSRDLTDVSNMTRDEVVPYYRYVIKHEVSDKEIVRINQLILSKWSSSGLLYIKEQAWKGNEYCFK
jgi:hypothetical protein